MDSAPLLAQAIGFLEASKYFLLFAGSYIEGSVVMLTGGILWHTGAVTFWPAYTALLLGDILADIMWYAIGYFGARHFVRRFGHYFGLTPPVMQKVEHRFHVHHTWILIVSKLTMGFGLAVATLTTAGMLKIPFWRYFVINLLGGIAWVYFLMIVGYNFGNVLEDVPREFQIGIAICGIVVFFFAIKTISARLAKSDW